MGVGYWCTLRDPPSRFGKRPHFFRIFFLLPSLRRGVTLMDNDRRTACEDRARILETEFAIVEAAHVCNGVKGSSWLVKIIFYFIWFLSDPGVLGSDLCVPISVCLSVSEGHFWNLTDVTLADQATNLIQADNANMAIQGNVAMQAVSYTHLTLPTTPYV